MRTFFALLTGALFLFPGLAGAQTASAAPAASPSATPAAAASSSPSPAGPSETPVLTVPAGWISKPYTMNMGNFTLIEMWYKPGGAGDNINLGYSPNPSGMDLAHVVPLVKMGLERMLGAGNVTDHAQKVCSGKADGWEFSGKMTMGAMRMTVHEVILPAKDAVFGATYTRQSAHAEDASATNALSTLCTKA